MYSREQLAAHMRAMGVRSGDVLMVHASVRAVGTIAGGPDQIHLAVTDVLNDYGTLLMYAGCPRFVDSVGRGILSRDEEAEVLEKLPPFDAASARANPSNGTLVEFFRTYAGARVNDHVVRFVARGAQAEYLLSGQPWNYAYGRDSPLVRFVQLRGKILLIGSDHDAVTFLHHVEHIAPIENRRIARFQVPILANGIRVWKDMEEFDTSSVGAHPNWPDRFFEQIVDKYLNVSGSVGGLVGDACSYLIDAQDFLTFALIEMEKTAGRPLGAT
jgi:aminoglycoside 3-N-acetyltransferase